MQTKLSRLTPVLAMMSIFFIAFQSCKKTVEPSTSVNGTEPTAGKKAQNQPPPPPPFYFSNCSSPQYAATLIAGSAVNITVTKNYLNSPGGSYAAFTSNTVNGITVTAPAGTFNAGSGSVAFTVSGTPVAAGLFSIIIAVGNITPCSINFNVANAPASGPTIDPGAAVGSTGVVNFVYRGQSVAYRTVRAGDGKVWLQQNLGSPQVASHHLDQSSYGDYFQWGRWDDEHQLANSATITGGVTLMNPSHIASGNPNFIKGTTATTKWWGTGGSASDTWNGTTATSTNGKDPCTALGAGWHMPTETDWQNLASHEDFEGTMAAFQSNLKLPAAGYRMSYSGQVSQNGDNGNYWSKTSSGSNTARVLVYDDNTYSAAIGTSDRGQGYPCRCVKD